MNPTTVSLSGSANDVSAIPRTAIVALAVASFGSGMSMRVTDPLLPRLAAEFGTTLGGASLVITVFSVAYGLSQFLFGPLGDRYGKYRVIAWGCLACAVTSLLCALAPDFYWLLLARVLAGATAAAIIPVSMAWIGDVVAYENRQPVLARFLIGQILGLSSGALIGGLCADYLSWRAPFFLISLCFIAIGFYLIALNKQLPLHARRQAGQEVTHHDETVRSTKRARGPLAQLTSEFSLVLAQAWVRVILVTVLLEGALVFGGMAFVASHLHAVHAISLARAGVLVMLFGLGGLLFAVRSRYLVSALGEAGLVRFGALLMALSLWTLAFAPSWHWAVPGCFFFGLGFYMLHTTLQINATQMAPERRGAAVAAFASCFFLGQSAGVAFGGGLLTATSFGTAHLLAGAGIGVLTIGQIFARLRAKRH